MKRTMSNALVIGIAIVFGVFTGAYAWESDTWGLITRAKIESTADAMINYGWTPRNTINNWEVGTDYWPFNAGTPYRGVAYSQVDPQQSLIEFADSVNTTTGGPTAYGNDCSGFVSMAWRLGERYATTGFESDATSTGDYVTSRGAIGFARNTILLSGDALVRGVVGGDNNHMVLFKERTVTGIKTREQTPHRAQNVVRDWAFFDLYRPIRRNSMDETLYTGNLPATGSLAYQPPGNYYYSTASGKHSGRLGGPNNNTTNFNLYLWKWNGTSWQVVARSTGSLSSEAIDYSGTPGYYSWGVWSISSSGNYELSIKRP